MTGEFMTTVVHTAKLYSTTDIQYKSYCSRHSSRKSHAAEHGKVHTNLPASIYVSNKKYNRFPGRLDPRKVSQIDKQSRRVRSIPCRQLNNLQYLY